MGGSYRCIVACAHWHWLWHWRHHYYSLVVWWGMKLCFTVVGQASPVGDGYQLVTVHTHGNFIELPHWNTMTCYPTPSHYPDTEPPSPCPILILLSARLWSDKHQLVWLNQDLKMQGQDPNPWPSDSPISQNRRWMLLLIRPPGLVRR